MDEFVESLKELTLAQIEERLNQWDAEVRAAKTKEELEGMDEKLKALQERHAELKELETRKNDALALQAGKVTGKPVETRKDNNMSDIEKRAKEFAETGRMETRAVLGTGRIVKPTKGATEVSGLPEVASDIVDDVNAIELTGTGAWVVGYKKTDAVAADVTDGSAVGGTASTYDYVTINPGEWGVLDQVSNQVKKMSNTNYMAAVEETALVALRSKASDKIVAAVKASTLTEKKYSVALDSDYVKNIVLGFRANKKKGGVCLYLAQADLMTLGKVRGTNEKKAVFEITFDEGSTTSGTIKEGGMAVRFRVLDQLSTGEQLFGQPKAIDMPMWDAYEIKTDEGGQYFAANQIGIRGLQTAGADLVAYHAMQLIKQSAEE